MIGRVGRLLWLSGRSRTLQGRVVSHAGPAVVPVPAPGAVRLGPSYLAGLLALLVAEVVALSLRFDLGVLKGDDRWWPRLLLGAPRFLQFALAAGAGALLLIPLRFGSRLWQPARADRTFTWPYLCGHLVAVAAFAALTGLLLSEAARTSAWAAAWFLLWLTLGLIAMLAWAACLVPPGSWLKLIAQGWPVGLAAVFIGLAAWAAGQLLASGWDWFGRSTLTAAETVLRCCCRDVVCVPERFWLGLPGFVVEISPACSGLEGMGLMAVFVGAYLWLFRADLRFPQAWILLPLGVALAWVANVGRIAALIAIGTWVSPKLAIGGFHSQAGWLAFLTIALGLVVVSRKTALFVATAEEQEATTTDPTVAYLCPLLVLIAAEMITAAVTAGFDYLYPIRVLATAAALWYFRASYAELRWTVSLPAVVGGVLAFAVWMALEPLAPAARAGSVSQALAEMPPALAAIWLTFRVVGSVVTVPLAEELAFRGYLARRLQAVDFLNVPPGRYTAFALFGSSVLFGALHGRWLAGTLAGLIYALTVSRRGQLSDGVVAHAVTNALIAACVLAAGAWQLW